MEGMALMDDGTQRNGGRKARGRLLLTGASGYIGSVVGAMLIERGYTVDGLDSCFYEAGRLFHDGGDRPRILMRDTRDVTADELRGYDFAVHLAELSNDPLCEFDEESTIDINHHGSVTFAAKARAAGIKRFVYASSCSVYGAGGDSTKTEESDPNPQTAYARCKMMVERDVRAMAGKDFVPVFLRNATAFGASPSMRFDIVLNNLAGLAWTTKRIAMTSDGTPWRPLVHVRDIGRAIICALEGDAKLVSGEVFNVGSDEQNYRVREIAEAVAAEFPGCDLSFGSNDADNRSYRVSFRKIHETFPDFACQWDARQGARELRQIFEQIAMTDSLFNAPVFTRLKRLRELKETRQLDASLRWYNAKVRSALDIAPAVAAA